MDPIVLYSCLIVAAQVLVSHGAVVTLPGLGDIEGTTTQSYLLNRTIYQFQGIPYAKPPVGELRFKRPQKYDSVWNGTRNFKSFGDCCMQPTSSHLFCAGKLSEDCLTLNVYSTKIKDGGNGTGQAVMVYIHGGSFLQGSAQVYGSEYLLDEDVLLVVPQYRLGLLGFLSLKTDAIPGNMGMLDIILALEWVRDNIHVFGGDANRVTLFGNSAGAAAVSLMPFSPLVEDGLIQRVIVQSGSAVTEWATDPQPVVHATQIAGYAGCTVADHMKLAECLREVSYEDLQGAHLMSLNYGSTPPTPGRGHHVVWNEAGANSFLTEDPAILLREGRFKSLPMMAGVTKHEGSNFMNDVYRKSINLDGSIIESPEQVEYLKYDVIRHILDIENVNDRTGFLASLLQAQYFKDSEMGNFTAMLPGLVDILGVADMKAPTLAMAKAMSRKERSYFYSFNFFGRHSFFDDYSVDSTLNKSLKGGVAHEGELFYLFPLGKVLNARERVTARRMVQLWTSFAKNGVPEADDTPDWPPMSTPEGPYLRIDQVPKVLQNFVKEEYMVAVKEGMTDPILNQPNFKNQTNSKSSNIKLVSSWTKVISGVLLAFTIL